MQRIVSTAPQAGGVQDFRPPGAEPFDASLQAKLKDALRAMGADYVPRTHHLVGKAPKYANRLLLETSPYLLQHAHNPVNWYPWGDEAFAAANRLRRPVFLSSGYSTCHWCHVMEEESFENEEIAEYLNSHYVCIKLDREERPDVDAIYMSAVQAIHQSGGWPMSVWLNEKREPFFAGTYFPPRDGARGARVGFLSLLKNLANLYAKEPDRVNANAESLVAAIRGEMEAQAASSSIAGSHSAATATAIASAIATVKRVFDPRHGGMRRAPKFPSNIPVRLLLRYHRRSGDKEALHIATFTLEKMAAGGMHDQLGGGFHRYSTDVEWLVPHFEKMLYDNALLATAYAEAYQVTQRADFARITRQTLDYILREMTSPEGGFYSATDADSEGVEGKFFVWSEKEVRAILGDGQQTDRFLRFYDITREGNWEESNILRVLHPDEGEWNALAPQRAMLYDARKKRIPPLRDEKILASWNGLMISAMANGGRILDEPRYIEAAKRALTFLIEKMRLQNGKLARSAKAGKIGASAGFLDDYAFVSAAALDLYDATLERRWLEVSLSLCEEMQRLFWDEKNGGWYKTSAEHESLIAREKSFNDGAEPAGSSVALLTCMRLAAITHRKEWQLAAQRGFGSIAVLLNQQPLAVAEALLAVDFVTDNVLDVAIIWPDGKSDSAAPLLGELRHHFVPSRVICGGEQSETEQLAKLCPWVAGKVATKDSATLYVCEADGTCRLPVQKAEDVAAALGKAKAYVLAHKEAASLH